MNLFGIADLYPESQNQQGVVIDGILKSITQYFAHQYGNTGCLMAEWHIQNGCEKYKNDLNYSKWFTYIIISAI